jgi:hypothetical protein
LAATVFNLSYLDGIEAREASGRWGRVADILQLYVKKLRKI